MYVHKYIFYTTEKLLHNVFYSILELCTKQNVDSLDANTLRFQNKKGKKN